MLLDEAQSLKTGDALIWTPRTPVPGVKKSVSVVFLRYTGAQAWVLFRGRYERRVVLRHLERATEPNNA